jgi:hypothetical protein
VGFGTGSASELGAAGRTRHVRRIVERAVSRMGGEPDTVQRLFEG